MTPMDADQVELLPCPFCSGEAVYEHLENTRWSVGCTDDEGECMGFQTLQTFARKVDAKRAWNTRAALTPAQTATPALMDEVREVERLRSILRGLELCNDGYALRNVYDGDADSDGRHIVVGGEIVATFVDSDDGEELRDAILVFSSLSRGASAVEDADHVAAAVAAKIERCTKVADEASNMRFQLYRENQALINAHRAKQVEEIAAAIRALPPEGDAS